MLLNKKPLSDSNLNTPAPGNLSQRQAITFFGGPLEVVAGPGSGKTFVLVNRILYLIRNRRILPESILVLTFSRAAAREMEERFLTESSGIQGVTFGTFHSVFYGILREYLPGKPINSETKARLLSELYRNITAGKDAFYTDPVFAASVLEDLISRRKSSGRIPEDCVLLTPSDFSLLYGYYNAWLKDHALYDFDDMILCCERLLTQRPGILSAVRRRWQHILLDEFQDINALQYRVIRLIAGDGSPDLFAVGDDDQSIYGFRGSDPSFLARFMEDYPAAERIFLQVNYRCGGKIIRSASSVIRENKDRIPKRIVPDDKRKDSSVEMIPCRDEKEEKEVLLSLLGKMTPAELSGTAVIFRTNLQVKKARAYLVDSLCPEEGAGAGKDAGSGASMPDGISSRNGAFLRGDTASQSGSSMQEETAKDLAAYLRLAGGIRNGALLREDLVRIMNRPQRFLVRQKLAGESFSEGELRAAFRGTPGEAPLVSLLGDLKTMAGLSPRLAARYVLRITGYRAFAQNSLFPGRDEEVHRHLEHLAELVSGASSLSDAVKILDAFRTPPKNGISPGAAGGDPVDRKSGPAADGPHLLTMHGCKGLEFDTVILPDLNEGILPSRKALSEEGVREERRLLYVAMTRARKRLVLMYLTGSPESPRAPSRFLSPLGVKKFEKGH